MKENKNISHNLDFNGKTIVNARLVNCKVEGVQTSPIVVEDIKGLTAAQLDSLDVGDMVIKVTGTDKHLYVVTYKATTGGGICLSYNAAGYGETVSYDRTESGWAYNSTDVKTYGEIPTLRVSAFEEIEDATKEEFAENFGISLSDVDKLFAGNYRRITDGSYFADLTNGVLPTDNYVALDFGATVYQNAGLYYHFIKVGDNYSMQNFEQ